MEMPAVATAKKKRGRPRKSKTMFKLLQLRVTPEVYAAIERSRQAQTLSTHAEAARRMLIQQLRADKLIDD